MKSKMKFGALILGHDPLYIRVECTLVKFAQLQKCATVTVDQIWAFIWNPFPKRFTAPNKYWTFYFPLTDAKNCGGKKSHINNCMLKLYNQTINWIKHKTQKIAKRIKQLLEICFIFICRTCYISGMGATDIDQRRIQ